MVNYFSKNQHREVRIEFVNGNAAWNINTGVVIVKDENKRVLKYPVGSVYDSYKAEQDAFFLAIDGKKDDLFICDFEQGAFTIELVDRYKK